MSFYLIQIKRIRDMAEGKIERETFHFYQANISKYDIKKRRKKNVKPKSDHTAIKTSSLFRWV